MPGRRTPSLTVGHLPVRRLFGYVDTDIGQGGDRVEGGQLLGLAPAGGLTTLVVRDAVPTEAEG